MRQQTQTNPSFAVTQRHSSLTRALIASIVLLWCGMLLQPARAQTGSVITDCANAQTIEEFVTLFGRGLCLNGFSSPRGWVFTDPADSTEALPDPPDPFPLPLIRYSGNLEFRAEAETINADEPDKFYIVSRDLSDLPPFQRPTLPHPQVIGPFFYGTVASPELVTLDQTDITQILDMQQNNSPDNRVVILQHAAGFDFNSPGVERFTGVRFEEADNDNLLIQQICPDNSRGTREYFLGLRGRANTGYTFSARIHDSDGNEVETVTLNVSTDSNGVAVTPPLSVPFGNNQFGFSLHDDVDQQTDANTITTDGQPLNPGLAAIKTNTAEPPIMWTNSDLAAKFAEGEKIPNSDSGYYFGPNDGSCDQLNRLYAINEFDGIEQDGTSVRQFIEIYTDQPNLNGLVLVSAISSTPLVPDDEPDRSLSSIDLDGLTPNADGYVVIGPEDTFFLVSEDEIHGLGLYELDEPIPFNTPLNTVRSAEYEFIEYKRLSADNMGHLIKGGNENGNGHPTRDSLQFCPDASEKTFPEEPLPAPATLGAKNNCDMPDSSGQSTVANMPEARDAGDPINAATGEFYTVPAVDIDLGGPLPLRFVRRYAAFLSDDGRVSSPLGTNWLHDFELQLTQPDSDTIEIIYFGGQVLRFLRDGGTGEWVLDEPLRIPFQLRFAGDEYRLMDPSRDRVYAFDGLNNLSLSFGRLESIEDRNGNRLNINYTFIVGGSRTIDRISDGLGRMLQFSYTGGQLTRISDGSRNLDFGYTSGILTSATNALGNTTQYSYDTSTSHGPLLTAIQLPEGNTPFSQTYNSTGTVTQQQDAFGNPMDIQLDTPAPGMTTIIDPAGSTVFTHDPHATAAIDVLDRTGASIQLTYDSASRPQTLFDQNTGNSQGISTRQYHAPSGNLASYTDAEGNTTSFTYQLQTQTFGTGAGTVSFDFYNLTQIEYADGSTVQLQHDAVGNVSTFVNPLGIATMVSHNNQGLVTSINGPDGGSLEFDYNPDGTLGTESDSATGLTVYQYDTLKRLIQILPPQTGEPSAPQINIIYDASDRITSIVDANGNTAQFSYDSNDNRVSIQDPNGLLTQFSYNLMDEIDAITNRLGSTRTRTYDALRRLASTTDADGITTAFGYNPRNDLTTVSIGGSTLILGYDSEGIPSSITTPLQHNTTLESDRMGRFTAIENPLGQRTEIGYDARSRVNEIRTADDRSIQYQFDANSSLIESTHLDASGTPNRNASYAYTDSGQLESLTDPNGESWGFQYSPEGRVQAMNDPLAQTTSFAQDGRGRLSQITFPDGDTRTLSYDANSNITQITHSGPLLLGYNFDALDRLTSTSGLDLSYDAEGVIIDSSSNGISFGASYTAASRLSSVSYNNGLFEVTYSYDPVTGLLTQVSDTLTGTVIDFSYDLDRRLTLIDRSNNTQTEFSYDAADRLTRIRGNHTVTGTDYLDLQYSLNAIGDVIDQSVVSPISLDSTLFTPAVQNFSVDAASQVNSAGFGYDTRGRRTQSQGDILAWDAANRLTGFNGQILSHNGLGDVITTLDTELHRYHYNAALGGRPMVAVQNAGGGFDQYFVFSPEGTLLYLIDINDGNAVHHFDFDRVGSTMVLTNINGNVSNAYAYLPYGQVLAQLGNIEQPFTFNGQYGIRQLDSSGRYYQMRARIYDSHTASFLTREPLWPMIANPDLLNPYQFAYQNPLSFLDINGLTGVRSDRAKQSLQQALTERARNEAELAKFFSNFTGSDLIQYAAVESPRISQTPIPIDSLGSVQSGVLNALPSTEELWDPSSSYNQTQRAIENRIQELLGEDEGDSRPLVPPAKPAVTIQIPDVITGYTASLIKSFSFRLQLFQITSLSRLCDPLKVIENSTPKCTKDCDGSRRLAIKFGCTVCRPSIATDVPPLTLDDPDLETPQKADPNDPEELRDGDCVL